MAVSIGIAGTDSVAGGRVDTAIYVTIVPDAVRYHRMYNSGELFVH